MLIADISCYPGEVRVAYFSQPVFNFTREEIICRLVRETGRKLCQFLSRERLFAIIKQKRVFTEQGAAEVFGVLKAVFRCKGGSFFKRSRHGKRDKGIVGVKIVQAKALL